MKGAPLSVSYYNEINGGHIRRAVVRTRCSAGPVLPLWLQQIGYLNRTFLLSNLTQPMAHRDCFFVCALEKILLLTYLVTYNYALMSH